MKGLVKFGIVLFCMVIWLGCATEIRVAPRHDAPPPPPAGRIHPRDLKVLQLEMSPDPIREGQRVSFQALVNNFSSYSARVNLFIRDRDEIIAQIYDLFLPPGESRVIFPQTYYRFSRNEYCFTVEVDIERTRSSIDLAKKFCAQRTPQGWTMASPRIGPLFVEDLDKRE